MDRDWAIAVAAQDIMSSRSALAARRDDDSAHDGDVASPLSIRRNIDQMLCRPTRGQAPSIIVLVDR